MVSEQELIERIRRGDLVSFKAVFERYYGGVHAFTRGVVDNGFHAEEITQNVFIRLWPVSYTHLTLPTKLEV